METWQWIVLTPWLVSAYVVMGSMFGMTLEADSQTGKAFMLIGWPIVLVVLTIILPFIAFWKGMRWLVKGP